MNCRGCYKESKHDYCLSCRGKLFNKRKVNAVLDFDAPKNSTLHLFQEHSKRLSISGVQLKYSLRLNGNQLELCEKGGEYILKPIPQARQLYNLNVAPENEHATMQIAEQIYNINTAYNGLIYFKDGQPAYITKRFDVGDDANKLLQEDFAQLLSRSRHTHGEAFKYEGNYEEIGNLIKQYVAASTPALEKFFKLVVFNYIFSNGDAHLKNFSLIRDVHGEYELTPAYDLMSTILHSPDETDMALSLYEGDIESKFYQHYGFYGKPDFMEFAKRLDIIEGRAVRILNEFINSKKNNDMIELVNRSFLSDDVKKTFIANCSEKIQRLNLK